MERQEENYEPTAGENDPDEAKADTEGEPNDQMAQAAIISEEEPESQGDAGPHAPTSEESDSESDGTFASAEEGNVWYRISRKFGLIAARSALKRYHRGILGGVLALCLITGSFLVKWRSVATDRKEVSLPVQVYLTSVSQELTDIFNFNSFLIFLPSPDKAYLSVNVSVKTSNDAVYHEIKRNRALCRSIIHKILNQISEEKGFNYRDTDQLKEEMLSALNAELRSGTVEEVLVGDLIHV